MKLPQPPHDIGFLTLLKKKIWYGGGVERRTFLPTAGTSLFTRGAHNMKRAFLLLFPEHNRNFFPSLLSLNYVIIIRCCNLYIYIYVCVCLLGSGRRTAWKRIQTPLWNPHNIELVSAKWKMTILLRRFTSVP